MVLVGTVYMPFLVAALSCLGIASSTSTGTNMYNNNNIDMIGSATENEASSFPTASGLDSPPKGQESVWDVPSFTLDDLKSERKTTELLEALHTTGLLSIQLFSDESIHEKQHPTSTNTARSVALTGLCQCADNLTTKSGSIQQGTMKGGVESILLSDDAQTRRTTIASATIGRSPLPLLSTLSQDCGKDTVNAMEDLRDQVAVASDAFIQALDRLLVSTSSQTYPHSVSNHALLKDARGGGFSTLQSIVESANHLEHFHHYQKQRTTLKSDEHKREESNRNNPTTLQWHTDAGMFLAFVPALNCHSNNDETKQGEMTDSSSFWVETPMGERVPAKFQTGSIAIMMGAGAEHWLQTTGIGSLAPLKATKHAVYMNEGDVRTWYGMMHLVPETAIIQEVPIQRTFGQMKQNMQLRTETGIDTGIDIGCGSNTASAPLSTSREAVDLHELSPTVPARRRLQHVEGGAAACNNATNFFCWQQCLEIPNYEQAETYTNEGYSLYCVDPKILAQSGNQVSEAVAPCDTHNSNCLGAWHPTSPFVEGQKVIFNVTASFYDDLEYCYGGTSMYMDGFHWIHDTTCIIYLFPGWVLSSEGKFAAACIGTILFGVLVEFVISKRRLSVTPMPAGYRRLLASAMYYALQLTMGYIIMLVIMIYSIPLFICVVLGLVIGHILFNAKDAFLGKSPPHIPKKVENALIGDTQDEECPEEQKKVIEQDGSMATTRECQCNIPVEDFALPDDEGCHCGMPASKPSCCENVMEDEDESSEGSSDDGLTPCCRNTL